MTLDYRERKEHIFQRYPQKENRQLMPKDLNSPRWFSNGLFLRTKIMRKGFRVLGCVDWSVMILVPTVSLICFIFPLASSCPESVVFTGIERSSSFQTNQNSVPHFEIVSQWYYLKSQKTELSISGLTGYNFSSFQATYSLKHIL